MQKIKVKAKLKVLISLASKVFNIIQTNKKQCKKLKLKGTWKIYLERIGMKLEGEKGINALKLYKLEGAAPLITDPPLTSFITLSNTFFSYIGHVTADTWHMTHDKWLVAHDR